MPATVKLTIRRAAGDVERSYDHDSTRDALRYARRLIADACRWGGADVYDISVGTSRWRVFGPRAGCGGRAEIIRRRGARCEWESVSAAIAAQQQLENLARDARIAPGGRGRRVRYVDSSRFAFVGQASNGDVS